MVQHVRGGSAAGRPEACLTLWRLLQLSLALSAWVVLGLRPKPWISKPSIERGAGRRGARLPTVLRLAAPSHSLSSRCLLMRLLGCNPCSQHSCSWWILPWPLQPDPVPFHALQAYSALEPDPWRIRAAPAAHGTWSQACSLLCGASCAVHLNRTPCSAMRPGRLVLPTVLPLVDFLVDMGTVP
jgi:hypothetical protein